MAQDTEPGFLAGAFLDLSGYHGADAAQTGLPVLLRAGGGDVVASSLTGAFRDDDQGKELALALALGDLRANAWRLNGISGIRITSPPPEIPA